MIFAMLFLRCGSETNGGANKQRITPIFRVWKFLEWKYANRVWFGDEVFCCQGCDVNDK